MPFCLVTRPTNMTDRPRRVDPETVEHVGAGVRPVLVGVDPVVNDVDPLGRRRAG